MCSSGAICWIPTRSRPGCGWRDCFAPLWQHLPVLGLVILACMPVYAVVVAVCQLLNKDYYYYTIINKELITPVSPSAGGDFNCCEECLITLKVLDQCSVVAVNHILVFLLVAEILQNFHYTVHAIQQRLSTQQHASVVQQDKTNFSIGVTSSSRILQYIYSTSFTAYNYDPVY